MYIRFLVWLSFSCKYKDWVQSPSVVWSLFFYFTLSPQIVSAVHYCHQKNIVHRDLKVIALFVKKKKAYLTKQCVNRNVHFLRMTWIKLLLNILQAPVQGYRLIMIFFLHVPLRKLKTQTWQFTFFSLFVFHHVVPLMFCAGREPAPWRWLQHQNSRLWIQ